MSNNLYNIKIYGASRCHKTIYYLDYFKKRNIKVKFLDVEKDEVAAMDLRALYTSGKLNFPTIIIEGKKLRNPSLDQIDKWLTKKGI